MRLMPRSPSTMLHACTIQPNNTAYCPHPYLDGRAGPLAATAQFPLSLDNRVLVYQPSSRARARGLLTHLALRLGDSRVKA